MNYLTEEKFYEEGSYEDTERDDPCLSYIVDINTEQYEGLRAIAEKLKKEYPVEEYDEEDDELFEETELLCCVYEDMTYKLFVHFYEEGEPFAIDYSIDLPDGEMPELRKNIEREIKKEKERLEKIFLNNKSKGEN